MGVFKCTESQGDNLISSFERRLWDLTYYCLLKYGCPVMFSVFGPNAPKRIDQHIRFFVSSEHLRKEEVKNFLKRELAVEVRASTIIKIPSTEATQLNSETVIFQKSEEREEYLWGCEVDILEYSGPNMYVENEYMRPMIKEMTDNFISSLSKKYNNEEKNEG